MPNKITINDYNLDADEARIYVAFTIWLQQHPYGGVFQYRDFKLEVKPVK